MLDYGCIPWGFTIKELLKNERKLKLEQLKKETQK